MRRKCSQSRNDVLSAMKSTFNHAFTVAGIMLASVEIAFSANVPLRTFDRERTQGSVRVVLLSVERTTFFTSQGVNSLSVNQIRAIPGLRVTCLVEALGGEVFTNKEIGKVAVMNESTNRVESRSEHVILGGSENVLSYDHFPFGEITKPPITDSKRTFIFRSWLRGMRVSGATVGLRITAGFNDHMETVEFKAVPLE